MLDHKLVVFYHLAKNPNTTKVAETLYQSQSAVSKSVKELEKELSITLFDRNKGRLQLTVAGEYLLKEVEELIGRERNIKFEIDRMRNSFSGTLKIGASTTLSQYILPEMLREFIRSEGFVQTEIISGNTQQIEEEIIANNLHLAFIEGLPVTPEIHYTPFLKDEIVLVCAAESSLPETISKEKLQELDFVFREKGSGTYDIIEKQLSLAGVRLNTLHNELILGTTEGIKRYIRHTECCAFLSVFSIRDEVMSGKLRVVDITDFSIERRFYVIHKQGQLDSYAQRFLDYVMKSSCVPPLQRE